MTKKKQNQKNTAVTKTAAQEKKRKKEEALQQKKQLQTKRQRYYGLAVVVVVLALIISFASSSVYGQPLYAWLQIVCYGFMGICGLLTILASRCEETDKKRLRMQAIGLVFLMIAAGMIVAQLVTVLK